MSISKRQIALLHVAKSRVGLSDKHYRCALVEVAGVTSSTELDAHGFDAMMGLFEWMGFKPLAPRGEDYGARTGMASFAQIQLIRTIWAEYSSGAQEDALNKWLERSFKVSSLRFLSAAVAPKVITALKAMKARRKAA